MVLVVVLGFWISRTSTMCRDLKGAQPWPRPLYARNGNFVLVFSTHAPHQGAFSRLPCSPRLCAGRGRRLGMRPQTQGSAGAAPWAIHISPLAGLGQNTQP